MTSLPPITLLMLCLLAATLLGGGIGACLWHLRSAGRVRRALEAARRERDTERKAFDDLLREERERATLKHAGMRDAVAEAREQSERDRTRHDTLAVHAREQGRRIDALEAEILAYEARLSSARRGDSRDLSRRNASAAPPPARGTRDDDDLPVLNRRVRAGEEGPALRPVSRSMSRSGTPNAVTGAIPESPFPLASDDIDIPTLSESELPDAADDRALGLLDTRNVSLDADD